MNKPPSQPSYLIVCFRFIGDVLVTTPLALSIRKAFPDAAVDYLVFQGTEKVLAKNPHIRNVITIPRDDSGFCTLVSLFRKYDFAIAAYPSDRTVVAAALSGKHAVGLIDGWKKEWWKNALLHHHEVCYDRIHVVANMLMPLRMLGIEPIPRVVMGYDDSDLSFARETVSFERYILLHPYSLKSYKYWPAHKWAVLATLIREKTGCTAVFTRTPEPEGDEFLKQIRACTSHIIEALDSVCTLNQLAAIIKGAQAFIGIDTSITHLAAAMDTPTIALFGPTLTRYWAPWPNDCTNQSVFAAGKGVQHYDYVTVVQKSWVCVPCNEETCSISNRNVMECLEQMDENEVLDALMVTLERINEKGIFDDDSLQKS